MRIALAAIILLAFFSHQALAGCCGQRVVDDKYLQPTEPIINALQPVIILEAADIDPQLTGQSWLLRASATEFSSPPVLLGRGLVTTIIRGVPRSVILEDEEGRALQLRDSTIAPGFKEVSLKVGTYFGRPGVPLGRVRVSVRVGSIADCQPLNTIELSFVQPSFAGLSFEELGRAKFDFEIDCKAAQPKTLFSVRGFSQPFSINHERDELVIEPIEALLADPGKLFGQKNFRVRMSAPQAFLPFLFNDPTTFRYEGAIHVVEITKPGLSIRDPRIRLAVQKPPISIASFGEDYLVTPELYSRGFGAAVPNAIVADYCGEKYPLDIEVIGEDAEGKRTNFGRARITYDIECKADVVVRVAPEVLYTRVLEKSTHLSFNLLSDYLHALRDEGIKARVEVSEKEFDGTESKRKNAILQRFKPKYLLLLGDNAASGIRKTPKSAYSLTASVVATSLPEQTFVDDAALAETLEPSIIAGRIPGDRADVEAYLKKFDTKEKRETLPALSAQPRIFSDSCGSDNCFMKTQANSFSNHLFQKDCGLPNCFLAPEYCKFALKEPFNTEPVVEQFGDAKFRACHNRDIFNTELAKSTLAIIIGHGAPAEINGWKRQEFFQNYWIYGRLSKSAQQKLKEPEIIPFQNSPLVISLACFNGRIGGDISRLVIQSGARNFIGHTEEAKSAGLPEEQELYFNTLAKCKKGEPIGEALFQAKQEMAKKLRTESGFTTGAKTYNLALVQLFGDPTLKCA